MTKGRYSIAVGIKSVSRPIRVNSDAVINVG